MKAVFHGKDFIFEAFGDDWWLNVEEVERICDKFCFKLFDFKGLFTEDVFLG
jgi:hypothetical protein